MIQSDKLSGKETGLIVGILSAIAILITIDLLNDYDEGKNIGHLLIEGFVVVIACAGIAFLLKSIFSSQKKTHLGAKRSGNPSSGIDEVEK